MTSLAPRSILETIWLLLRRVEVFLTVHLLAFCSIFTSPTWLDWSLFAGFLFVRAYVTSVGYHRYFAHRAFKTSRPVQFLMGVLCCLNLQNGPIWWAALHRHHHRHSDDEHDYHSPTQGGFFWAHCGWLFCMLEYPDWNRVRDLRRFPELVWLDRLWLVPPILAGLACWYFGGWSLLCIAFCLSAVINMHGTYAVNSLGHMVGSRRYETKDQSRNSYILACFTCGDGWHNNHHHYPHSAQHGFFWYEIDGAYNVLRCLRRLGVVWDLRDVPPHKLRSGEVLEKQEMTSIGGAS